MFVHNMVLLPLCTLAVTPPDSTPETSEPTHSPDAKLSNCNHPMACSGDQGENSNS